MPAIMPGFPFVKHRKEAWCSLRVSFDKPQNRLCPRGDLVTGPSKELRKARRLPGLFHVGLVSMDVSDKGFGHENQNSAHCHCKWKVVMLMTTTPFNYSILGLGPTIQTARIKLHAGSFHPAGYPFHSGPQQQGLVRIQCK